MKYIKLLEYLNLPPGVELLDQNITDININSYLNDTPKMTKLEISKIENIFKPITDNLIFISKKDISINQPLIIIEDHYKHNKNIINYLQIISNTKNIIRIYKIKDDYYFVSINKGSDLYISLSNYSCYYKCDQITPLIIFLKRLVIILSEDLIISPIYMKDIDRMFFYNSDSLKNFEKISNQELKQIIDSLKPSLRNDFSKDKIFRKSFSIFKNDGYYYVIGGTDTSNPYEAENINALIFLLNHTNCLKNI